MQKKISKRDKIFIAGANGMVGSAICRALAKLGYGDIKKTGGEILRPSRQELDLLDAAPPLIGVDKLAEDLPALDLTG